MSCTAYAQDVCNDGSIFVDRDGEHFGHILEYMRDGVMSVAEPDAHPSVSLLRALKCEFGYYCIELCLDEPIESELPGMAYVLGGVGNGVENLSRMERHDVVFEQWNAVASMSIGRAQFSACVYEGELYTIGGYHGSYHSDSTRSNSVEKYSPASDTWTGVDKYSPASDTWTGVAPLPVGRVDHATLVVKSAMYVLGGETDDGITASILKFDSAVGSWSEVAPMPAPRESFASCVHKSIDERGEDHDAQVSVFKFNTEAKEWSIQAPMPVQSAWHSASVLHGQIYIVGAGDTGRGVLRFDPMTNAWGTLAQIHCDREYGMYFVLAGCLYSTGGGNANASMERYDVATNPWTSVAAMLEIRRNFCVVCIES
jgi:hypothetical protein